MKKTIVEYKGIGEDAERMHHDHEVQMARSDCYHAAKYAVELHKMLEQVSELEGLDGWVQEKLTLACDYLRTVHEYMQHEMNHSHEDQPVVFETAEAEARFAELLEGSDEEDDAYSDLGYKKRNRIKGSGKSVNPKDQVVPLSDVPIKKPRGHKQYDPKSDFPKVFKEEIDESVFNETMSSSIASSMGQMNRPGNKVGSLFGGSYSQDNNPFKDALGKKPKNRIIRRR